MAYGLKIVTSGGATVIDQERRYNNNVMSGTVTVPAGSPTGTVTPFIPLTNANDPNQFLIFFSTLLGGGVYTPVVGPAGFRWRSLAPVGETQYIEYLVVRHG